jgi:CelD/BcsL family acetyltransferase involved in cellulose biosynthesis
MQLELYHSTAGFDVLKPDWNRLLRASAGNTVFSTWEWQTVWWRHFGAGEPWIVSARADDGQLAAIFPCFCAVNVAGERQMQLIGCADLADYLDLIIAKGREPEGLTAFLGAVSSPAAPAWDCVELCNIPQDSPTLQLLPDLARAAGLTVQVAQADVCPLIPLPATFDAYLAGIDKKQRHEIRRKQRRLEMEASEMGAGPQVYVVDARHDLEREVTAFVQLHRQSSGDKLGFMDERMAAFFQDLAGAMAAAGWLQLMQMYLGGRPVASLFSFDYGDAILLYNSGFEPAGPYAFLSPGNVLIGLAIQHAIGLGRRAFDFMRGDEEYKYRFGARDTAIYRIQLRRGV